MRELETERLRLRHLVKEDAGCIYTGWASDPEVTRYLEWKPHESVKVTEKILDGWLQEYEEPDCYRWGIELKSNNDLIGMIDVVRWENGNPVIGYASSRKYWGNGYMTESLHAVIDELFQCGYQRILIDAVDKNIGSNKVILKNGFHLIRQEERLISKDNPKMEKINYYELEKN